ncbi:carbohydrate ABC transporter permease [Catenovulum sp. 2E275]|uniref:carbohydrate ABC transporter permease n=1 Tax=Catenovulum sp. 2E275 TaxID=2980497 RepID=UPI0021D02603|nr:carbohydrate ABC transporter permease [Catenovulum sp. 2E275]MCU4677021.1 carbohydrate ABC transporter permease [Catenovulum sp. 2E275]
MVKVKLIQVIKWIVLGLLAVLFVSPLLFMLAASFKSDQQIFTQQNIAQSFNPFNGVGLANYQYVFEHTPFFTYLMNSVIITTCSVVLSVLVNSMAAYSLLRFPWRHKQVLLLGLLALLIIPFEAIVLPLVFVVTNLPWLAFENGEFSLSFSWFNSLQVQIIPELANPFFIYLIYQYLKNIPKDYEEAALLDGASIWKIYFSIVLPLAKPILATVAILTFLRSWNAYLLPVLVAQAQEVRPLMPGMQQFFGHSTSWGAIMAYASLISLPVLILFCILQKYFVSGIQGGIRR